MTADIDNLNVQQYRQIFEGMPNGFALSEIINDEQDRPSDYRFLEVNEAFEQFTGMKRDEIIGRRILEIKSETESYSWIKNFGRVVQTGSPLQIENYSPKLGRWYKIFSYRIALKQFAIILTDITERKEAEENLILEHSEVASLNRILRIFVEEDGDDLFDKVLNFVLENTASRYGVFGYIAETGSLVCPSLSKMFNQCEMESKCIHYPPEKWKGLWARALQEKCSVFSNEPSPVPEGHIAIQNNLAAPILFGGEVIGLLNLANKEGGYTESDRELLENIAERLAPPLYAWIQKKLRDDERSEAEAKLRRLNETLEYRVAERSQLAEIRAKQLQELAVELIEAEMRERRRIADLLHADLQQILTATNFQLQVASRRLPPEPTLAKVEHLLNDCISKSRYLSHELSPAVLHHSELISVMEWLSQQMREQFGLKVTIETDNEKQFLNSSLKVFAFRAVQELLFNAVKHAGVSTVNISLSNSTEGIITVVSDEGQGFDPEDVLSVSGKSGFGLLNLQERAKCLGGNLIFESSPGLGSKFTLTLPFDLSGNDLQGKTTKQHQSQEKKIGTESPGSAEIRVLLADDHQVMRQGLIQIMADQPNIEVVGEAANGQEALEMVRILKPDVVVIDTSMPEMDGIEATQRIKAEMPDVKIIGHSIHESDYIAQLLKQAGAEGLVSKGSSSLDLIEAIYKITGKD